jgi:hypothetical protein
MTRPVDVPQFNAALEAARGDAHKGDAIAVFRVNIGLHLEHEADDLRLLGRNRPRLCRLQARRRGQLSDPAQQFAHAEIIEPAAKIERGQMARAIELKVEGRAQTLRHLDLLVQFGEGGFRQQRAVSGCRGRCSGPARRPGRGRRVDQQQRIGEQVVGAEEVAPIPLLNPVGGCGFTWRAVKREHGISVSSAVMSLEYEGLAFNLLDTLGHQDFGEVTHRPLTAVDSTVMVLDAAKGIKEQTRKPFELCSRSAACAGADHHLSTSWPQSATRSTSSRAPPRP